MVTQHSDQDNHDPMVVRVCGGTRLADVNVVRYFPYYYYHLIMFNAH